MGIIHYFVSFGLKYGAFGVFLGSLLESMGVPFASVSLTLASGSLIASGKVTFLQIIVAGTVGNVVGSSLSYWLGYYFGDIIVKKRGYIFKSDNSIHQFIEKYGSLSVFLGQLYGTVRAFISFPAGMMKMDFKKFIFYTFLGGLAFSIVVTSFSLVIRDAYYKFLFPYLGMSFGTAAFLFMVIFVATHLSVRHGGKIKDGITDIFSKNDEYN